MRISEQQLTFSSDYRQQQLQLRQQTTLPGQALPVRELALRGEQTQYDEHTLSTISKFQSPNADQLKCYWRSNQMYWHPCYYPLYNFFLIYYQL